MPEKVLFYWAAVFIPALALWLGYRLIKVLRSKRTNTELWAAVFEGLMQKTVNLEPIKEPEIFIEKKAEKDGQDDERQLAVAEELEKEQGKRSEDRS